MTEDDQFEFLNDLPIPDELKEQLKESLRPPEAQPERPPLDVCQAVADDLDVDLELVRKVLNSAIQQVAKPLTEDKRVKVTGFGTIESLDQGIRLLRNPGTGEQVGKLKCDFTLDENTAELFPPNEIPPAEPSDKSYPEHEFTPQLVVKSSDFDQVKNRSKFGGSPTFIQDSQTVGKCMPCNKEMTFIGQVDSQDLSGLEQSPPLGFSNPESFRNYKPPLFGDAGVMYFYFCFECGNGTSELVTH